MLVVVVLLSLGYGAFAQDASKVTDAGNQVCPVSGDEVDPQSSLVYNGKQYNLCCQMCEKDFKKDPEKYIAAMGK